MRVLAAFFLILVATLAAAGGPVLPAGWRYPTKEELGREPLRHQSPNGFSVASGDFNGDGVPDAAYVLISTTSSGEGLLVRLSRPEHQFEWLVLRTMQLDGSRALFGPEMGVHTISPGRHQFLCIAVAPNCQVLDGERKVVVTQLPAIEYFKFESASQMFVWNKQMRQFDVFPLSD